jgi:hypothetical protein
MVAIESGEVPFFTRELRVAVNAGWVLVAHVLPTAARGRSSSTTGAVCPVADSAFASR